MRLCLLLHAALAHGVHSFSTGSAASPPASERITVYHVNEHKAGAIPVNMDTGNAVGDLMFDLMMVLMVPLSCNAQNGSHSSSTCGNPEAVGQDLVVNKLTLEADSHYSEYAKCNVGVNGTDQHGNECEDGRYCCYCDHEKPWTEYGSYAYSYDAPYPACEKTVGRMDLGKNWGSGSSSHHWGGCSYNGSTYHVDQCYQSAMIQKLNSTKVPALWYSSLASGYCASPCAPLPPQPHKKRRRPCARSLTALRSSRQTVRSARGMSSRWTRLSRASATWPSSARPSRRARPRPRASTRAAGRRPTPPRGAGPTASTRRRSAPRAARRAARWRACRSRR